MALFVLSLCPFDISVGVGAFVIGLGQISFLSESSFTKYVWLFGWLVVLKIYVALVICQLYRDLEAGDNQSLKIQVTRPGIEPWTSCSASEELNHSTTATPQNVFFKESNA